MFSFFLFFPYHSSCRKDQFTVLSLKFGTQDFTDPGLQKIRWTLTGLSLWFRLVFVCYWVFLWMRYLILSCFAILPFQNDIHGWSNSSVWRKKSIKKKMLMALLQKHVWESVRVGKGKTKTNFRWTHRDVVTIPWIPAPCQFSSSLSFCQPPAEATWSVLKFPIRKPRNGESQIKMILTILF